MDSCAHRCADVQSLVLQVSRLTGQSPEAVRLGAGLSREYVPVTPLPQCPPSGCGTTPA